MFIGVGYPAAGCADHSTEHFQPFGSFNLSHADRLILENSVNERFTVYGQGFRNTDRVESAQDIRKTFRFRDGLHLER